MDFFKALAIARPRKGDFEVDRDLYRGWLRHAQVQASRAGELSDSSDAERDAQLSVVPRAHNDVRRLGCLHPDAQDVGPLASGEEDPILDSLCQFDVYVALAVIGVSGDPGSGSFYTNFARFYERRVMRAFRTIVMDREARLVLFDGDDQALADAIRSIAEMARSESSSFHGFLQKGRFKHSSTRTLIARGGGDPYMGQSRFARSR